jgi:hypothetical protein
MVVVATKYIIVQRPRPAFGFQAASRGKNRQASLGDKGLCVGGTGARPSRIPPIDVKHSDLHAMVRSMDIPEAKFVPS